MVERVADARLKFALDVQRKLTEAGFTAYWAGGCVRDRLLGREPKDYDVATNAEPDQIQQVFGRRRSLRIGAAFGVITVVGPRAAGQIEVATFRRDETYSDGRRPDAVTFTGPEEDARRRDFTINGLFYDPLADRVIDYVGGRDDLAGRLVRAIGDARERFTEDKLRMLRAVRFAAAFDFALDEETLAAVQSMAGEISVVSAERIAQEMRRLLVDPHRVRGVELLHEARLLPLIAPEASLLAEASDALTTPDSPWRRTLAVLGALEAPSFPLALAALLVNVGEGPRAQQVATELCLRWKLANKETERTTWLVGHYAAIVDAARMPWSRLQPILTSDDAEDLIALLAAHARAGLADQKTVDYLRAKRSLPPEELNPPPLLTGRDLLDEGVPKGRRYTSLLKAVRDAQLEKTIHTKAEALALVDRLLAEEQASRRADP